MAKLDFSNMLHKFRISHEFKDGVNIGKVYLDDQELHGVRSVDMSIGVDEIPTVKIEFITFNIDAETEVKMDE